MYTVTKTNQNPTIMITHTLTHIHTHTHSHAHTHIHSSSYTHSCTHNTYICTYTHTSCVRAYIPGNIAPYADKTCVHNDICCNWGIYIHVPKYNYYYTDYTYHFIQYIKAL